jgi:hypothetical protein
LHYYDWLESIGKYGPYHVYMVAGDIFTPN